MITAAGIGAAPLDSPPLDPGRVAAIEATLGRANRDALLRMIVDHARRGPGAIAAAAAEGRHDRVRAEAHALRGAVAAFGGERLAAVLYAIEHGEPLARDDARLHDLHAAADAVAAMAEALLG